MQTAAPHQLTLAVLAEEDQDSERTSASALASAARAGASVELFVAWSGSAPGPPPAALSVPTKTMFRLGRAYVKNRVLDDAGSPVVAFAYAGTEITHSWIGAVIRSFAEAPQLGLVFAAAGSGSGKAWTNRLESGGALRELLATLRTRGAPALAIRRDAALAVGGFQVEIAYDVVNTYEDLDLALRLVQAGHPVTSCAAMTPASVSREIRSVDYSRQIGAIARRRRSLRLCTLYGASLSPTKLPDTLRDVRSFANGFLAQPRHLSPTLAWEAMPSAIREFLGGVLIEPLAASRPPKTHLMYAAGEKLLLHVYANPSARLGRSLRDREAIRARVAIDGIPALHVAAEGVDTLWVVEDRLHGAHPAADNAPLWFDHVAHWAVQFAGEPGPPLHSSTGWNDHREAVLAASPGAARAGIAMALDAVARMPSVHMHGDFQRRNLLLADRRVGVVDWEGAWLRGIPGLDLVFLALLARADAADGNIISRLLIGEDPPFGALTSYLSRVGVTGTILRPALLVMLATWTLGEQRRLVRTRAAATTPRPYRDLLLAFAPRLTLDHDRRA